MITEIFILEAHEISTVTCLGDVRRHDILKENRMEVKLGVKRTRVH